MNFLRTVAGFFDKADALTALSLALLGYGCFLIWEPLGYVVPGTILLSFVYIGLVRRQ